MKRTAFVMLCLAVLIAPTAALADDDASATDRRVIDEVKTRPTDRPADKPTDRPIARITDQVKDRSSDRPTDRVTDRVKDRETDRVTDRWSPRHRWFHKVATRCLEHHGINVERLTHRQLHKLGHRCLYHHRVHGWTDVPQ